MAQRWTKDSVAQKTLETLFDSGEVSSTTKAHEAYKLHPLFQAYNFPAFLKHFDSTANMRFGSAKSGKRKVSVVQESDDEVPFLGSKKVIPRGGGSDELDLKSPITISNLECLVTKFYDYKKRENVAVVVVTPPNGAKGRCEVDPDDLSLFRVMWPWTEAICNAEVLLGKECQSSSRTHQMIGAIKKHLWKGVEEMDNVQKRSVEFACHFLSESRKNA
ncbi:hypothetical protein AC1031_020808 [Aphanomyces cochlioides]|nr:hypothetical protein AC1031_020808 [Aphanomyces cochlioides]